MTGDGRIHPLLLPEVISEVLSFLPVLDVEYYRLVCQSWNLAACRVLRKKFVVVFMEPGAVRLYNDTMRNTISFPHAQFEFSILDFTGLLDKNLREFWTTFGPHIETLEFQQRHLFWRDLLNVISQNVPNLKRVAFRNIPRKFPQSPNAATEEDRRRRQVVLSVKELRLASLPASHAEAVDRLTDLLKTFPNLEVIEFLPIEEAAVNTKVSNVLIEVLQKPEVSLPSLRRLLNLNLELSSEGLDTLASKHSPLQSLQITLSNGVRATAFHSLMRSLAASLSNLRVTFPNFFEGGQSFAAAHSMRPEECVQVLSSVKELEMYNFRGSLNFMGKMRELETLDITASNMVPFELRHRHSKGSEDHKLKRLKILPTTRGTEIAGTLSLESISRCFPWLNAIHLQGVDDEGLGMIYRNLPLLSEVELTRSECTDQGLTGIPLEGCNGMVVTMTYLVVQAEKYRRDLFIGSLPYLRKFSVDAPNISNASITLGLTDCKSLRELKISSSLITDSGVIFIADKFGGQLDFLDLSECTQVTEQSKSFAYEKLGVKPKVAQIIRPQRTRIVLSRSRGIPTNNRATAAVTRSSHATYMTERTTFFEEAQASLPARHSNRFERLLEALERNEDLMRYLERLDDEDVNFQHPEQLSREPEAQLFHLGLEPGDVEFLIQNRQMFENRIENGGQDAPTGLEGIRIVCLYSFPW